MVKYIPFLNTDIVGMNMQGFLYMDLFFLCDIPKSKYIATDGIYNHDSG